PCLRAVPQLCAQPFAPLLDVSALSPLQPATLPLIPRMLHRREHTLHLPRLVAIDLLQPELIVLPLVDELLHPILVGSPRGQLGVQSLIDLPLARADRLALPLEALLGRLQLGGLVVGNPQS